MHASKITLGSPGRWCKITLVWRAPVEPGLDGGMTAIVGEAGGGHVVGQACEAVQLRALVQRAAKLRQHNREALQAKETHMSKYVRNKLQLQVMRLQTLRKGCKRAWQVILKMQPVEVQLKACKREQ